MLFFLRKYIKKSLYYGANVTLMLLFATEQSRADSSYTTKLQCPSQQHLQERMRYYPEIDPDHLQVSESLIRWRIFVFNFETITTKEKKESYPKVLKEVTENSSGSPALSYNGCCTYYSFTQTPSTVAIFAVTGIING